MKIQSLFFSLFSLLIPHLIFGRECGKQVFKKPENQSEWINAALDEIKEEQLTGKSINCPEIENGNFTAKPPFNVLGLPRCKDHVKPVVEMYHSSLEGACIMNPFYLPNAETNACIDHLKNDASLTNLYLVTHGFTSHSKNDWVVRTRNALLEKSPNSAVIVVGHGERFKDLLEYRHVAADTRYVGRVFHTIVKEIHQAMGSSKHLKTHCIGFSLGAHICGFLGMDMIDDQDPFAYKIDRITGIDPAGPMFFNDGSLPLLPTIPQGGQLNKDFADMVDVLHTDAKSNFLFYSGTIHPAGHLDFYAGHNGKYGYMMPSCGGLFESGASCSHHIAPYYFIENVIHRNCFASRKCSDEPMNNDISSVCSNSTEAVTFGLWLEEHDTSPGIYTFEVTSHEPYCGVY